MLLPIVIILTGTSYSMTRKTTGYSLQVTGSHYPGDKLLQCARTLTREDSESASISATGICSALSREWLENRTTVPGFAYIAAVLKDIQFQPPIQVNSSPFKIAIPGLLGTGSSVNAHVSTSTANVTLYLLLGMNNGDVALKTMMKYRNQRIRFDHRIAGVWQKAFVQADAVLTVDKVYKLTLRPSEKSVEVYLDDSLVTIYSHADNPFTAKDALRIIFDSRLGFGSLHRITIFVS